MEDKNTSYALYVVFIMSIVGVIIWSFCKSYELNDDALIIEETSAPLWQEVRDNSLSDWDIFTMALIWVESKGICDAVGSKNDVGVLQITPILVTDCNRIIGYDKYSLEDRLDSLKSVEMFNLIQDHYNPQHDYHWALKLWNSGAPLSYHRKVMDRFNEIKLENDSRF